MSQQRVAASPITTSSYDSLSERKTTKRSKDKSKKYLNQKNDLKSFESIQQGVLLALLNTFCDFSLELPTKLSTVTLNNPRLVSLVIGDEEINVKRLSERMYADSFICEMQRGVKEETCVRTYEKKKRIFINNFLVDVALELGFVFDSKYSRKSRQTLQLERVQRIFKDGQLVMDRDDIIKRGKAINKYLFSLVSNNNSVTIARNNGTLQKLLLSDVCLTPFGINLTK
ncbi:hypothetical protein EIN_154560 [Entamoeba invadens IP1]|uniref:Uncharacterized protein n=1 Tax=Entamoeba invadens IP1 TaxID=370355 RepID=A0A0A1U932_ENTIV|nr:hypothetical protein EIN_154560 [Entamoeba invadens IP1]ELP91389.1 hypothetical protein EIN_154560 [Entamoeba invadens IP1]|eukprot:XP_004258160.1 hypothetical protein EIN_154560 [Entamoeba invadens IP1]